MIETMATYPFPSFELTNKPT